MKKIILILFVFLAACESNSANQNSQEIQLNSEIKNMQKQIVEKNIKINELLAEVERLNKLINNNTTQELVNQNEKIENLLTEVNNLKEKIVLEQNRADEKLTRYVGENKFLKMTLEKSLEISQLPSEELIRQEALSLIQDAIEFIRRSFVYSTLKCSSTEVYENRYYLVTDEKIKTINDLKSRIGDFYTEELVDNLINKFVEYEGNQVKNPMYISEHNKLYTVCGDKGMNPMIWEGWEYSIFQFIQKSESNDRYIVKLILPVREDSEEFTENRYKIYFTKKKIEFKKVKNEWKLNTDIFGLT